MDLQNQTLEGIAILNIPSIYGGANIWGEPEKKKKNIKKVNGNSDKGTLVNANQGKISPPLMFVVKTWIGDIFKLTFVYFEWYYPFNSYCQFYFEM